MLSWFKKLTSPVLATPQTAKRHLTPPRNPPLPVPPRRGERPPPPAGPEPPLNPTGESALRPHLIQEDLPELLPGSSEPRAMTPEQIAEEWIAEARAMGTRELYLNGLGLTRIPYAIGGLDELEYLAIHDNPLTSLPYTLARLGKLKRLFAWNTELTEYPACLRSLPALRDVQLSGGQIHSLPAWVGECASLRTLHLAGNRLTQLPPEMGGLGNLEWLDLSDNDLDRLPETLRQLPRLQVLLLHGNPKLGLPPEMLGRREGDSFPAPNIPFAAPRALLDYHYRIQEGAAPLNEARLLLLGPGNAGKTCLVNRLLRDRFLETSRTEGIRTEPWKMALGGEEVKLQVWDFGGPEVMHPTPQSFLTRRSLYLLVLAGRQGGEDADAEAWLQAIECLGGESPVIVVLNKSHEQPFTLDYRGLAARYPGIRAFVHVDCRDGSGIADLREVIEHATADLEGLRAPFPAAWVSIKDRVASMAERGERFIDYLTYTQICANLGESDPAAQAQLAGCLHTLGLVLHYRDDPSLCDTHLLSPHWVAAGLHGLLHWPGLAAHGGILRAHDLGKALDPAAYPRGKHLLLLHLMCQLDVCFEYPADLQGRYLVPQLLDKEQTPLADEFDPRECLNFQYHYLLLPPGVLPRFIVRTHALSGPPGRWRSGVVLDFEGNRALVSADPAARRISISINGPAESRRRLLALIRSDFERIHADGPRLAVTAMVPVPGHPGWVVPYQELCVLEKHGLGSVPRVFEGQIVLLPISEMLAAVELPAASRPSDEPLSRRAAPAVFIGYSHRDEPWRAELEAHLKLLQRQGLISGWTDRRIPPGEDWGGQIDRRLESAEIILLLVSADFLASHYCYDVEMNRALQRHESGEAVVLPILVRDVDLRGAHFAHLPALPRDARAVTLWLDREDAWREVAEGIRAAIEQRRAAPEH